MAEPTPESGTPEPGTPETGTPEPGTPETGTPEPGTPESGTPGLGGPGFGAAGATGIGYVGTGFEPVAEHPETAVRPRRRVDVFTLFAGVVALLIAGYVLSDGSDWLPVMDLRWVLAGGAVLVGVLMLIASVAGGRRRSD